jgi:hypothetical protein
MRKFLDSLKKWRSERRAAAGERAIRRNAAKAQRIQHERMDDKMPR